MKNILVVIGTRPEAIKLVPVLKAISQSKCLKAISCLTGQHLDLSNEFFKSQNLKLDHLLTPPNAKDSIAIKAAHILAELDKLISQVRPDLVIVQGDTTSAFVACLASFYNKIKVAHVEAGLRTNDLASPWPEEMHRQLIDRMSDFYFAPTIIAKNNLINEGINENKIWVVGNTSIDALRTMKKSITKKSKHSKQIVVTLHRRESYGQPLVEISHALKEISHKYKEVKIKYCLHPNPAVTKYTKSLLSGIDNIDLLPAQQHDEFINIVNESSFIITDSGGIQEEATYLGKPVLITRDTTERHETILAGNGIITNRMSKNIFYQCQQLLDNSDKMKSMSVKSTPYGLGYASVSIVRILEERL